MPTRLRLAASLAAALPLACAARLGALENVPDVPMPKKWDAFTIMVYQFATGIERDQALYESVNLHAFHIDQRNDGRMAIAKRIGWPYYLDHAADKGYLYLREHLPATLDVQPRPHSLADPGTVEAMHQRIQTNVGAAKGTPAIAYGFDDEISLGNFCSPFEVDSSEPSLAKFRAELKATYGDIDKLNAEYGTSYSGFDAVPPLSFEKVREQLRSDNLARVNIAPWSDWHTAMDTQFADCLAELTRFTNQLSSEAPAGFTGGQCPDAFGGYDYRKLTKAVQWMEAYDIGGSDAVLGSLWTQKRPRVQTFFSSGDPKKDSWFLWHYLCEGDRGVICWPNIDGANKPWFHDGQVADFIKANADTFKEVQGPVSRLIVDAEAAPDPVALYYSQPSIQAVWAFDVTVHGNTWRNRSSSIDGNLSTSNLDRIGWLRTLADAGIQPRFVHQDHLLGTGGLKAMGVKVLVLDRVLCLSDAEAKAIEAFAKDGGTVVADVQCGIFDEHGKARATGALDALFGVKRDLAKGWLDGKMLTEVDSEADYSSLTDKTWAVGAPRHAGVAVFERGLAATGAAKAEQVDGAAVVVRAPHAVYLNLSPIGYVLHRSDGKADAWRDLVAGVLKDAGVEPRVRAALQGEGPKLETIFRTGDKRTILCVDANIDRSATINGFGASGGIAGGDEAKLTLSFAKPVKNLKNERTGKVLGDGASFTDAFTPWQANVYSFAP